MFGFFQAKEEESYYYEYPYYEDMDGNPHQSQTYTDTVEKDAKVAPPEPGLVHVFPSGPSKTPAMPFR